MEQGETNVTTLRNVAEWNKAMAKSKHMISDRERHTRNAADCLSRAARLEKAAVTSA